MRGPLFSRNPRGLESVDLGWQEATRFRCSRNIALSWKPVTRQALIEKKRQRDMVWKSFPEVTGVIRAWNGFAHFEVFQEQWAKYRKRDLVWMQFFSVENFGKKKKALLPPPPCLKSIRLVICFSWGKISFHRDHTESMSWHGLAAWPT